MTLAQQDRPLADLTIPGLLDVHTTPNGLVYLSVETATAQAIIYLQGAHLTDWQPKGHEAVLFLSPKSDLAPGKPIRGGVPIAFPWFAVDTRSDRLNGKPGPSHGFARTEDWTLAHTAVLGDDLHLTFTLAPNATTRAFGYDHFRAAFHLILGATLTMRLTIANDGVTPLAFEEAFHTYFAVSDVRHATVTGLEPTPYIDKTDNASSKPAAHAPLTCSAFTDRIYNHTTATCTIHDPAGHRRITIEKTNSDTTVVFNPFKALPDLADADWPHMLCVETVNASHSPITLAPGQTHTMQAVITVDRIESGC